MGYQEHESSGLLTVKKEQTRCNAKELGRCHGEQHFHLEGFPKGGFRASKITDCVF